MLLQEELKRSLALGWKDNIIYLHHRLWLQWLIDESSRMGQSGSYCTQCQSPISYWGSTMADQSCNCDSRWPPWNDPEYNYDCSGSYFRPIYHQLGGGGGAPRSFCENDNNPSPYYVRCDEPPLVWELLLLALIRIALSDLEEWLHDMQVCSSTPGSFLPRYEKMTDGITF
jgi:hypothetical protein